MLIAKQLSQAEARRKKLATICTAFPEATIEEIGEGHLTFRIRKKIFAYYLLDHHGDGRIAFWCKSTLAEQGQLIREEPEIFFRPPYVGHRGWIGVRIDLDKVEWHTVQDLALRAYQSAAPRKLAALAQAE